MAHLVNPISFRLGYSRFWNSQWASLAKHEAAYLNIRDTLISNYITRTFERHQERIRSSWSLASLKLFSIHSYVFVFFFLKYQQFNTSELVSWFRSWWKRYFSKYALWVSMKNRIQKPNKQFAKRKISVVKQLVQEKNINKHLILVPWFKSKNVKKYRFLLKKNFSFEKKYVYKRIRKYLYIPTFSSARYTRYDTFYKLAYIYSNEASWSKKNDRNILNFKQQFFSDSVVSKKSNFLLNRDFSALLVDKQQLSFNKKKSYQVYKNSTTRLIKNLNHIRKRPMQQDLKAHSLRRIKKLIRWRHMVWAVQYKNTKHTRLKWNLFLLFYFVYYLLFFKYKVLFFKRIFREDLKKFFNLKTTVFVYSILLPIETFTARYVSRYIRLKLLHKFPLKNIMRLMIDKLNMAILALEITGFKLQFSGRFSRKDRATYVWKRFGKVTLNQVANIMDYSLMLVVLINSTCGIKVWLTRHSVMRRGLII